MTPKANGKTPCGYMCSEAPITDKIVGGSLTTNLDGKSTVACDKDIRNIPWCDDKLTNWACCISPTASCGKNEQVGEVLADTGNRDVERLPVCMDKAMQKKKAFRCVLPPGDYTKTCSSKPEMTEDIAKGLCTMTTSCKTSQDGPENPASFTYKPADVALKYVTNSQGLLVHKPPFTCQPPVGSYLETCTGAQSLPDYFKGTCTVTAKCKNPKGEQVDAKYEYEASKDSQVYLTNSNGQLVDKVPYPCRAYTEPTTVDRQCTDVKVVPDTRHKKCVFTAKCKNDSGVERDTTYTYDPLTTNGVYLRSTNGIVTNLAGRDVPVCRPLGNYGPTCKDSYVVTEYDTTTPMNTKCSIKSKCKAKDNSYHDTSVTYLMSQEHQRFFANENGALTNKPPFTCDKPGGDWAAKGCTMSSLVPDFSNGKCTFNASCGGPPGHHVYNHGAGGSIFLTNFNKMLVQKTEKVDTHTVSYQAPCDKTCTDHDIVAQQLQKFTQSSQYQSELMRDGKAEAQARGGSFTTNMQPINPREISSSCHMEKIAVGHHWQREQTGTHTHHYGFMGTMSRQVPTYSNILKTDYADKMMGMKSCQVDMKLVADEYI